ncbi:MAG: hypothetical protein JO364_13335 [Pseudonocardiales bacterium]|nr:hypothetical protein [Pseudonocardiales bacterium]
MLDPFAVVTDGVELGAERVFRPPFLGSEVKEVILFLVELGEVGRELVPHLLGELAVARFRLIDE